jgi:small subunit ribosomal protein S11
MAEKEEKTQIEEIEEELAKKKAKEKEAEKGEEKVSEEDIKEDGEDKGEGEKIKKLKKDRTGVLYVYTSQNNTILSITDMAGNTISRSSGGQSTKQSRLKSSPTVAMFAAKKVGEEAKEAGITNLYVRIRAQTGSTSPGSASHAIIKSLTREGFKILNIMDITKQPRGGPKAKGGRRGRRV